MPIQPGTPHSNRLSPGPAFAAGTISDILPFFLHEHENPFVQQHLQAIITWLLMMLAARAGGKGKQSFARQIASRFMGLIVLARGLQFMLTGLKSFFAVTS